MHEALKMNLKLGSGGEWRGVEGSGGEWRGVEGRVKRYRAGKS